MTKSDLTARDFTADDAPVAPVAPERMDPRLLELLVCPVTKGRLSYDADAQELISHKAQLAFPIKNGVPLMTVDAARHLDAAKHEKG